MYCYGRCENAENYWSTSHPLFTPGLRYVIRFQQIYHYLHLADSTAQVPYGQPGYDPLFKVRKFLDQVTPKLESEYNPQENMSVDEAGFKQYRKDNLPSGGSKCLCCLISPMGTYIDHVCTGVNSDLSTSEMGLSSKVVTKLVRGLVGSSPKLYLDNYYTNPRLFL